MNSVPLTINWGIFRGLCIANSISEKTISIHFDQNFAIDSPDQIPQGYNSAGISGSPLITLVENNSGINYWRLGGIIYEAQPNWDIMLVFPKEVFTLLKTEAFYLPSSDKIQLLINSSFTILFKFNRNF